MKKVIVIVAKIKNHKTMAEESKKLSFNPKTGKWENIPEEEKIRNNKNFKVGGKTVAVLYTYKPFWSVYDTVLLVADGKEAHYTVTKYQRDVNFSKADNQEYDYYGAIANQRVRYDLALRNPELVPRYEDNIIGLGIQPVFDDVEMAKDYAERTRNKIVATPKEILGNYFVFLNKPQAEYTRNDYITMEDYPIPNMFNNITYRVPVYLTSQADMVSVVDTLKDEGYDIKGDGVKIVWHIDFDKEENAKNFARHLHDLMVDNSKLSKPYSDLLDLFRNPNPKADEQLYRRIDTMEEYTKSMSRYRDGAFDATLEGKNIFTLDRITKDLPQTEIASVRYDNGKITFTGKDGNTYRLEHLSEESIKNLINIERNIIESEERARSPKDIPYYYSVFDLTEDYMKEEYDKASVTDDKARFLELAKEADWDYNLSTDLIYKSPLRKDGDEIIAKDNKYTVVYNKNNGESYHIYRNITEQDVRDLIVSSSSKLDLGDNPTADVKNLASLIEKEKAVNETNVIPEKVSFDNKEDLKAYITDYCNKHGWDSDLNHIDVSRITDMSDLFKHTEFNGDISQWDTSNVQNMSKMFADTPFNQPIGNWNTSKVTNMEFMFCDSAFNQPINDWDISNVTSTRNMFAYTDFNQPLDKWNTSNVTNMAGMFYRTLFNQPLDNWNISKVEDMSWMFEENKTLEKMPDWKLDPSIITKYMFAETKFSGKEFQYKVEDNSKIKFLYKEDLNNYIFDYCNKHGWDSDLNHIDVSGISDMSYLFYSTTFTGDISKWNTSNVVNMNSMFSYSQFNGDISNWDVSKVKDMRFMFEESPFSQSLDKWDMSNVRDVSHMFANTPLEGKELKLKNNTHMESRSYTLPEEKEQGMAKEPSAAKVASDLYSPEAVVARIKARISASMKTGNIPLSSLTTAVATKFKQLYSGARNLTTTSDTREVSLDVDCRYAFDKALAYASKHDGKWLNIKDNAYPITIPFNSPLTHYGAVLSALTAQEKGYATNVFCGAESLKQMGIELKKGEQPISVPIDNIDGQMIKKLYNIDQTTMSKDLPTKYNQYFTKYSSKAKPESLYLHKCHEAYIHGQEGQMLRMFRLGDRFVAFDNDAKAIENALSGKDFNYNHRRVNTSDVYESKYDRTLGGLVMSINSKYMEQVIAHISPEVGKISIHDAKNMIENNNTPDKVYDLFHDFIQSRADNFGVKVESCDYARTHFDSENNTLYLRGITDYSKPKSIIDKEAELGNIFRALADMAQKRIGLHNLGLDNLKPEDAKKYSALLSEISAGSHLLQRNLPARISDENKSLIPYWRKELRENPNIKAIIEKGVNNIHEMMTTTKIQKYGENMSVSGVVNRKPRLMTITEDLGGNINYINHEATIVYDPKKNRADVLLPTGASPYSFNEIAGMEKDVFTKALSAKGINEINFFNRDGYCAMRYPNIYFDKKNIEVVTVKNGNVIKIGDVDVKDEIERTSKVKINNVILIRNDDRRFELCIYPDGEKPLSIEPDFDDIDKFFKILKMPNKNESSLLREAMGQKYYYKAQEHPEIKTSLLEPSVSDEIKNRLDKVVVTKDYNTNKPILIASIDGELQPVTNISVDQYQRMWLVESEEYRSDYKYALASKVFAEKLNLANSEKSDISVDTNDKQEKKPEPVSVQSAKGSVENGEGDEQQDTTPDETIEQDENKQVRRGGRGR